jgi:hypothetical protein
LLALQGIDPPPRQLILDYCHYGYHPFSSLLTFLPSKGGGIDAVTGWYSLHIFILQIMFKNKDEEEEDDPTPSQNRLYKEQQGYYSQQDYYRQTILLFVYEPEPVIQGAAGILFTAGLLQARSSFFCL